MLEESKPVMNSLETGENKPVDPGAGPPREVRWTRICRVHLLWWMIRAAAVFSRLPPSGWGVRLGAVLGGLAGRIPTGGQRRALENLEKCYGTALTEADRTVLVRKMFAHLGRGVFELFHLAYLAPGALDDEIEVDGLKFFHEARERGKGIILVTGHIGNWELMAAWVAQRVKLTVVARYLPNWKLNEWLVAVRARQGVTTLYRGSPRTARESLRCLRRGETLGILIDQDTRVDGVFVPFFGHPAFTPVGAAALAERTGATLLPCCIYREKGRHRICFSRPVEIPKLPHRQGRRTECTARLTACLEGFIRRHPEQWVWLHRRFKTTLETAMDGSSTGDSSKTMPGSSL